jgi:hypothetical protein
MIGPGGDPDSQGPRIGPKGRTGERLGQFAGWLALLVFPLLLALGGYYRPLLRGSGAWPIHGDAAFYVYQLSRIGELHGQWWKLGQDDLVGGPYQPEFGKHPGVYEGIDLLFLSTITSHWLDPITNYHVMLIVVLVVNGWIFGWVVRRLTNSWFWASIGVVMVSWNYSTAFRLQGHAHLFKFGWTILAVMAFSHYLDEPTRRRSLVLGFMMALVLQGSFYLGSFLAMVCGVWWLACLIASSLSWRHVRGAALASLTYAATALVFTFPVWTVARSRLLADAYHSHGRIDAWSLSAELWQYFLSPASQIARFYVHEFSSRFHLEKGVFEGWHYPGLMVLLAIAIWLVWRLRRQPLPISDPCLLDRLMGLSGLLVVLSLAGGPSFFLVSGLGCFRAYGRAGLLALALWCVAAPMILQGAIRSWRFARLRHLICLTVLCACLGEGFQATVWRPWDRHTEIPSWVDWLALQPRHVHLAAFAPPSPSTADSWGYDSLLYRQMHHHACLNGSEFLLFESDLRLLGATYHRMNPAGLRFVASLGYTTLAFHREYLSVNPWIRSLPWLDCVDDRSPWLFYRVKGPFDELPRRSLEEVLASWRARDVPPEVPRGCWITERFDLEGEAVVERAPRVWLVWADDLDRKVGEPTPALFQHVFGPDLPAFSVKTPSAPGQYRLLVMDERNRVLQSRRFQVRADVETILAHPSFPIDQLDAGRFVRLRTDPRQGPRALVLENTSPYYLQANTSREQVYLKSARSHPGALRPSAGSLVVKVAALSRDRGVAEPEITLLLPCDAPPQTAIGLPLPEVLAGTLEHPGQLSFRPHFHGSGEELIAPTPPDLRLARGRARDLIRR